MFPKVTALRLLSLVGFIIACTMAYDALPSPVRSIMVLIVLVGGTFLMRLWSIADAAADETGEHDPIAEDVPPATGRKVYRVRLWVRLTSVAVPLLGLFSFIAPEFVNPEWENGIPLSEAAVVATIYLVLGLAIWAAFRSRLDVDDHFVRVVNPFNTQSFPRADVRTARAGTRGLELILEDGRVVVVFAIQCVAGTGTPGSRPRWVEVARAVTGRDPDTGFIP
ncbi:PH domain-containing protein [Actinosynnema sp. CA-248983]